jgi:hypothetical protein
MVVRRGFVSDFFWVREGRSKSDGGGDVDGNWITCAQVWFCPRTKVGLYRARLISYPA